MGRITARRRVTRIRRGDDAVPALVSTRADLLAVEEPLEIRVDGVTLTVTMRTPGHDVELATGLLLAEGIIGAADDLVTARYCAGTDADGANTYNVLDVNLASSAPPFDPSIARHLTTTSACGICGTTSIDAVRARSTHDPGTDPMQVDVDTLLALPDRLRAGQAVFDKTGGLHAAALFDAGTDGGGLDPLVLREDIGRHNAVDKVIGWAAQQGLLPLTGHILQVSGRASFELVQKAAMAGVPVLSAVSAPSSLAAELASEVGMTLAGFVRDDSLVLYSRADRVHVPVGNPTPAG
ncbi:formate dehydrogenase accessory sulfurtransferase FdhD [Gordonia soli]|uniref:Sulfur carrier protein FdhD n=1 Tax=Gordonia soli NBRC 108243 TaxID=1223545 RepID=M0QCS7_9ACTN|nr:formate dehydrogenase accessory sulfurtransferase FdhD [Gordonia soli]GAC66244.1 FdhD homolog [Gordonia soli NBRC 108243]